MTATPANFTPCAPGYVTDNGHDVVGWSVEHGTWWPVVFREGQLTLSRATKSVNAQLMVIT
jgi:hypothetical protein